MIRASKWVTVGTLATASAMFSLGCNGAHPTGYADQRPDPNQLTDGDSGLQSKDVIQSTDQLVADLLSSKALNTSATQWTLAVGNVDDQTTDRLFSTNYDIFIESLRSDISEKGEGRIQLIENRATFDKLRNQEMEGGGDTYGQTGGGNAPSAAINPQYMLYGKAYDMPNRETNFYMLQFDIVNFQNRTQVWSRRYQVKVAR